MVQNEKLNKDIQKSTHVNRKYKDSLFRIAFREKENLLELYNAVNNSNYEDPSDLTVYTMEDVIFMGIKNDISFLVGEMLNLYEHQSTRNPNMPIRGLMYFAKNYEDYIARQNLDIFSSTLQKLPFPQYYVLYNGERDEADKRIIELKNAFPRLEGMEPCLNCTATLLNINYGHNREIMDRSRTLRDYSIYVQRIRDNRTLGMNLEEAVERATEDSIRDGVLKDILLKNSAEVKNMVLGEWGTQNHIRKQKEEQEQLERELERKRNELKEKQDELKEKQDELKEKQDELKEKQDELEEKQSELEQSQSEKEKLRNELKKALTDESYRKKLLEEYQL